MALVSIRQLHMTRSLRAVNRYARRHRRQLCQSTEIEELSIISPKNIQPKRQPEICLIGK